MTQHLSLFTPATSGLWVQRLLQQEQRTLWITWGNEQELYESKHCIKAFNPELDVLIYPQWDTPPYAAVSPSGHIQMQRQLVLDKLKTKSEKPYVILSPQLGLLQKVTAQNTSSSKIYIKAGTSIKLQTLSDTLINRGFSKTTTVYTKGTFCVRGGIIDIFPEEAKYPYRIDLFGDEVDAIHSFDPSTQLRHKEYSIQELEINSHSDIVLSNESIDRFKQNYTTYIPAAAKSYYHQNILNHTPPKGWEQLYPLFFDVLSPLPKLFPNILFLAPDHSTFSDTLTDIKTAHEYRKQIWESNSPDEQSLPPVQPSMLYCTDVQAEILSAPNTYIYTPFSHHNADICDAKTPPVLNGSSLEERYKSAREYAEQNSQKLIISTNEDSDLKRARALIPKAAPHSSWKDLQTTKESVSLWNSPLLHGVETSKNLVLTSSELMGERKKTFKKTHSSIKPEDIIAQASQLNTGDLAIHRQHGLGRYLGLQAVEIFNATHDCLLLEYAGDDKLYLPVENIEMLSRYGADQQNITLDKIGGSAWESRQKRVKKQLKTIAKYLMGIAAKRSLKTAPKVYINEGKYAEFCQYFPFVETNDQLNAINDAISDMTSGKAMDRLICGDVGFGKTEVALRAAFATVTSGLQVCIVAPTTILARQHYATFKARFKDSNTEIFQVSRLVKPSEIKNVEEHIAQGKPCIVIGTHALLNPKFKFSNLGLLIVDEEQMFGVKQKEKIKELSENVHILTLTATPIPRTLQLSLLGIKDMSLIATPPVDRRAIQTTICEEDPIVTYKAIEHEIQRGGQVFYVCPRVSDLEEIKSTLQKKFPKLKITIAHGQLTAANIEKELTNFIDHKTDILISTQIIESGIDIPNTNTMIIHKAHLFGLSQLYQLRGRIGRSHKQAFAYFIIPSDRSITASAIKRLQVMSTLDTLGAGFTLASHDLDIRGAGNLLGEEQSGHIKDVGVELYQDMLKQAITLLKKETSESTEDDDFWSPTLSLGLSVALPESYISDINLRMEIYQKLGKISSCDGVSDAKQELIDRFGKLPVEAENLIDTLNIKSLCRQAHIQKVESGPNGVVFTFRNNECPYVDKLLSLVQTNFNYKLRPDSKLFYAWSINDIHQRIKQVTSVCHTLINMTTS